MLLPPFSHCKSISPIRSKPQRTYDILRDEYSPEGDHIPTLLARILRNGSNSPKHTRVRKALARFGAESGLFDGVDVKQWGEQPGDPFQVQVTVAGVPDNLADVGYGVSQALPIIVETTLNTDDRHVLLLQQPEVHLHPRAQAALGSFFVDLAAGGERLFLIETHSDHLVDRVRQEVAAGKISPGDVSILFFHKPKRETTVYPIALDEHGNVLDAPAEYRSFFLQEEMNLLNRTSG
jgi:hypothetical protein